MADQNLVVEVFIEAGGAVKGAKAVDAALGNVEDSAKRTAKATDAVGEASDKALKDKLGKGGVNAANQARTSIFNLNRVVQDAPYGFIGMANNIDPAAESIGRLIKEAGGGKQALKAMAGVIMGPAGIFAAISILTSVFVAFGPKIMAALRPAREELEALKGAFDDLLKVEFDFGSFKLTSVEQAETALAKVNAEIDRLTDQARIERLGVNMGGKNRDQLDALEMEIAGWEALKERIEAASSTISAAEKAAGLLKQTIGETTEIDTKASDEMFADLDKKNEYLEEQLGFWEKLTGGVYDNARAVEEHGRTMEEEAKKQKEFYDSLERNFNDAMRSQEDRIGANDDFLQEIADRQKAQADAQNEQYQTNIAFRLEGEQKLREAALQTAAAIEQAAEKTQQAQERMVESVIRSSGSLIDTYIRIARAMLAEAVVRTLSRVPWPLNLAAAGAVATFANKFFSGISGGGGGGSQVSGRPTEYRSDSSPTGSFAPLGKVSMPSSPAMDPSRELVAIRKAIQDQQFVLEGSTFKAGLSETNRIHRRAGIR